MNKDYRTIKQVNNSYVALDNECIYYCSTKQDLEDLMNYTLESETSKGISSEAYDNNLEALKEFNSIKGSITTLDKINQYNTIKEAIIYNSKELNVSITELCNDMAYVIDLSNEYNITFEEAKEITNKIEKEVYNDSIKELVKEHLQDIEDSRFFDDIVSYLKAFKVTKDNIKDYLIEYGYTELEEK